jgi:hypothetical protein
MFCATASLLSRIHLKSKLAFQVCPDCSVEPGCERNNSLKKGTDSRKKLARQQFFGKLPCEEEHLPLPTIFLPSLVEYLKLGI